MAAPGYSPIKNILRPKTRRENELAEKICEKPAFSGELLRGLRAALELGWGRQALANRIGPLIDTIAEAIEHEGKRIGWTPQNLLEDEEESSADYVENSHVNYKQFPLTPLYTLFMQRRKNMTDEELEREVEMENRLDKLTELLTTTRPEDIERQIDKHLIEIEKLKRFKKLIGGTEKKEKVDRVAQMMEIFAANGNVAISIPEIAEKLGCKAQAIS